MKELFSAGGHWFKGNLHMHTTCSDGSLSPKAAAAIYKNAGYDFIALTDHWKQSAGSSETGFLELPGGEWDIGDGVHFPVFHIVGVGMEAPVDLIHSPSLHPQQVIDAIDAAGGLPILAHPAWSVTDPADCMPLRGLCGAEVYNTVSGLPWNNRPDSSLYFDIWASKRKLMRCMAADDSHGYKGEQTRSFIMVRAQALTAPAIKEAIAAGEFYASQGPLFRSVAVSDDAVEVECEGAETIVFQSNTVWCRDRVATGGASFARYEIKPSDRYVRIELIDAQGNRAWSSPFFVNEDR